MQKFAGQEVNVKKLCSKENITNHGEDQSGFVSMAFCIY